LWKNSRNVYNFKPKGSNNKGNFKLHAYLEGGAGGGVGVGVGGWIFVGVLRDLKKHKTSSIYDSTYA
jgi:hypothetical protein